jgi:2-polyprenyl-3-methyl-5-hydroxy-6-metoxy-1,4-benzoquinol methylase
MIPETQANREAWNAVAKSHYENYHIQKLLAGEPLLSEVIKSEVGDVRGKSLVHLLCHIGTDTLSWRLLGAQVTGVDISTEAIQYAKKLAGQTGLDATFITADVMELMGQLEPVYDIVFASTGVLCWIPDIDRFAMTVRQLLKPGGFFFLHDGHPFRTILEKNEQGEAVVKNDYFHSGAWEYEDFKDYVNQDLQILTKSYEWSWSLGSVINAFCKSGMRIDFLHEYPQFFYAGYTGFDEEINKRELFPCTFSLKAIAE